MSRNQGFSLVETLVAMALATTAIAAVALTLNAVHRCHREVGDHTRSETELHRFAVQLRSDAHRALSAEPEGDTTEVLKLVLSDQEYVQYTLQAGRVQRDQHRNDKRVHHDTYRLPNDSTPQWERNDNGEIPLIIVRLEPEDVQPSVPAGGRPVQIKAAVGLLLMFAF